MYLRVCVYVMMLVCPPRVPICVHAVACACVPASVNDRARDTCDVRLPRVSSYEELSRKLLGPRWERAVNVNIFIFCFGTAVAYIVAVGDVLVPVRACARV